MSNDACRVCGTPTTLLRDRVGPTCSAEVMGGLANRHDARACAHGGASWHERLARLDLPLEARAELLAVLRELLPARSPDAAFAEDLVWPGPSGPIVVPRPSPDWLAWLGALRAAADAGDVDDVRRRVREAKPLRDRHGRVARDVLDHPLLRVGLDVLDRVERGAWPAPHAPGGAPASPV